MVLASLDEFHDGLHAGLTERILKTFGTEAGDYDLSREYMDGTVSLGKKCPDQRQCRTRLELCW